ncbi:hypothetical protein [Candidatus Macondimonas diazotrophica]|jgi:hypothetical protein|uniref:Uncharacterized protein n=1 Tax=Candidatus Macondimonas diazotrophica TaxID=2305248 RepID=A0A4Z0F606_9GAMM|nr:hypothetical protein [Candidatus Macondimonas diazotrophica]TFZ81671.1 hypothetical protein E4680_11415 [Candidatus Macondimonas diazotrophica]
MTSEPDYYTWEEREQWYIDKYPPAYRDNDPKGIKKAAAFEVLKNALMIEKLIKGNDAGENVHE